MYYNHLSIALLIVPLIVSHFDLNYGIIQMQIVYCGYEKPNPTYLTRLNRS
jgi:hypothetical protein